VQPEHFTEVISGDVGGLVITPALAPGALALLLVLTFVRREKMVNSPAEFVQVVAGRFEPVPFVYL
jgi:hypothetical protein